MTPAQRKYDTDLAASMRQHGATDRAALPQDFGHAQGCCRSHRCAERSVPVDRAESKHGQDKQPASTPDQAPRLEPVRDRWRRLQKN